MPSILHEFFRSLIKGQNPNRLTHASSVISETKPPAYSENLVAHESKVIDDLPKSLELLPDPHWSPMLPGTEYFEIAAGKSSRKIAYTMSGNLNAHKVLLCLPGLLETKSAFTILHAYFLRFSECKVISVDFSGRGESDSLGTEEQYKMSVYLSDVGALIESIIFKDFNHQPHLTILGTSMGGVLAMYLAQRYRWMIDEIILNDVALTVNWTSLYALYKSMHNEIGYSEIRDLARELSVDQRAITEVQLPTHFDLSYRADVWGMNFYDALKDYRGRVGLIYGSESKICTPRRVKEARSLIPNLNTCEVYGAGHPAPFDLKVCEFIQEEMGVKG